METTITNNAKSRVFPNKLHLGMLVMAFTVTMIMLGVYFQMRRLETFVEEYDEDDYPFDYEYMGDREEKELNKIQQLKSLKQKIGQINRNQVIINHQDQFGPFKDTNFVIVIQVHQNTEIMYIDFLIDCLKTATAISNSLLIFTHDSFDEDINEHIKKIDFTKFIQIYYPYSTQLYPRTFPGPDSKLCINGFVCEQSLLRYEGFTQKKHFWWWQMNYVFDKLFILQNYSKAVLFLESNEYLVSDFIITYKTMEALSRIKCPECEMLCLGSDRAPNLYKFLMYNGNVTITPWNQAHGGVGLAFNRTVWNSIKNYSALFCNHNDYRWEASLRHLGKKRENGQFIVMASVASRVYTYHKCDGFVDCSASSMIEDGGNFIKSVSEDLYPNSLKIMRRNRKLEKEESELGAWEDDRDKGLCMYMANM